MASRTLFLIAANLLIPVAILIFASGFFPYKPFLSGLAQYEALEYGPPPEAPFDKVIFMVVDALRRYGFNRSFRKELTMIVTLSIRRFLDLDLLRGMIRSLTKLFELANNKCCSLISNGAAIPFTAHATSPTITMPRIKAITTGSIPSFLDVILNFAESDTTSTLATQDTWLAQMKAKGGGKMVMYGDDTWLKLFPETFDRADGTSSFFVAVSSFKSIVHSIELNIFVRTLRRWTIMLPGMSQKSLSMMTGIQWYFTTLDWTILDIRPGHEGMPTL